MLTSTPLSNSAPSCEAHTLHVCTSYVLFQLVLTNPLTYQTWLRTYVSWHISTSKIETASLVAYLIAEMFGNVMMSLRNGKAIWVMYYMIFATNHIHIAQSLTCYYNFIISYWLLWSVILLHHTLLMAANIDCLQTLQLSQQLMDNHTSICTLETSYVGTFQKCDDEYGSDVQRE